LRGKFKIKEFKLAADFKLRVCIEAGLRTFKKIQGVHIFTLEFRGKLINRNLDVRTSHGQELLRACFTNPN